MPVRYRRYGISVPVALLFLVALAQAEDQPGRRQATDSSANVMFFQASPDAPAVDLYAGDKRVKDEVGLGEMTGYQKVRPGLTEVKVKATKGDTTLVPAQVNLRSDTSYSMFVVDSASNASLLVVQDNLRRPPAGKALARFVNLSPDSPALTVATERGKLLFRDKEFRQYTDFEPLEPGTYSLQLRLAGTDSVMVKVAETTIEANKIYTIIARGFLKGRGERALMLEMMENK